MYIAVYNVYIGMTSASVSSPSRIIILFVLVLSWLEHTCRLVVVRHQATVYHLATVLRCAR